LIISAHSCALYGAVIELIVRLPARRNQVWDFRC